MINYKGKLIDTKDKVVMAILNVTTDSFYDGGRKLTADRLISSAREQISAGATILDIGGCSSRPNAIRVSLEEELRQVEWALNTLKEEFSSVVVSIDTYRQKVAERALEIWGEVIVNDISSGDEDSRMIDFVAANSLPYIAMHYILNENSGEDCTKQIVRFFCEKCEVFERKGIKDTILDVGFGFGKNLEQNFEIVSNFERFKIFERPLLVGLSRKSMIYRTLECTPNEALNGTTALNAILATKGADIFRVHDSKEAMEVIKLTKLL
ncbi:MAG: dihydropteroate synthase [Rikenellaceae bacterium]